MRCHTMMLPPADWPLAQAIATLLPRYDADTAASATPPYCYVCMIRVTPPPPLRRAFEPPRHFMPSIRCCAWLSPLARLPLGQIGQGQRHASFGHCRFSPLSLLADCRDMTLAG